MKKTRNSSLSHPAYRRQQAILDKLAMEFGVACFRPDYHAQGTDKNTVMFYTLENAQANLELERGLETHVMAYPEYKPYFWVFENTDVNGQKSYDFANHGALDLRSIHYVETLRDAIRKALQRQEAA